MPEKNSQATLYTLLIVSTLTVMAGATIAPALPAMQEHFAEVENADFWVRLVLTIPGLFIVIGAFFAGLIIDKYSKKKFLLGSILVYAFAGSSGLFLDSLPAILIGRAIMGFGVAGIMTTVITLFADYFKGEERAKALGQQSAFMALGGVVFLTLGGFLADINWRYPFAIYLSALLFLPLGFKFLYEPERKQLSEAEMKELPSILSFTSLLKLLVFVYGLILSGQIIFYTVPIHLPFYLKLLVGASATQSGLSIALVTLFAGGMSFAYGRIKVRIGYVYIMLASFALIGGGYIIVGLASNYSIIIVGLIVIGIGFGMFMPNVNTWLAEVAPEQFRGRVMGGITTFVFLGQFLSPIATQPINDWLSLTGLYIICGVFLVSASLIMLIGRNALIRLCEKVSSLNLNN